MDATIDGSFDANLGTFTMYSNDASNQNDWLKAKTQSFYHLKVVNDYASAVKGSLKLGEGNFFSVIGDLVFEGIGGVSIIDGTINAKGDLYHTNSAADFQGGNTVIEINGPGTQTIYGASGVAAGAFVFLRINKSLGTLYLRDVVNLGGGWEYLQGTIDAETYNSQLNFRSLGVSYNISGNCTLNHVSFEASETFNNFYLDTTELVILGDLSLLGTGSLHLQSGTLVIEGDAYLNNSGANGGGGMNLIFAGDRAQRMVSSVAAGQSILPNIGIYKSDGLLSSSGTISVSGHIRQRKGDFHPGAGETTWHFLGNGTAQEIDIPSSRYGFRDVVMNPTSGSVKLVHDLQVWGDMEVSTGKTLDLNGRYVSIKADWTNNGHVSTDAGGVAFTGNELQTISGTSAASMPNLEIANGAGLRLLADLDVTGSAEFTAGELDLNGHTLELSSSEAYAFVPGMGSIKPASTGEVRLNSEGERTYHVPYKGVASTTHGYEYRELQFRTDRSEAQTYDLYIDANSDLNLKLDLPNLAGSQDIRITMITNAGMDLPLDVHVDAIGRFTGVDYQDPNNGLTYTVHHTDKGGGHIVIGQLDDYFDDIIVRMPAVKRNWISETHYDADGNVIYSTKTYMDGLGRKDQYQMENIETGDVLASQVVFDALGRPALYTLPAVSGGALSYRDDFARDASNTTYDYLDFDLPANRNNPSAFSAATSNTVGHYYSSAGDEHIDETGYPFTRRRYAPQPGGPQIATAQPGESFKPGSDHEQWSFSMAVYDELDLVLGNNKSHKVEVSSSNKLQSSAISITGGVSAVKRIEHLPSGEETVTYVNAEGVTMASCRSGLSSSSCSTQTATNVLRMEGTRSVDLHLPASKVGTLELPPLTYGSPSTNADAANYNYLIYDLRNDQLLLEGSSADYTIDPVTRLVTFSPAPTESMMLRVYLQVDLAYEEGLASPLNDVNLHYELDYAQWTLNRTDLAGLVRQSISAKDCSCDNSGAHAFYESYDYNAFGQVVTEKLPDEGEVNYLYDDRGRLRFKQDASQEEDETFTFISYDAHGRVIKEGEYITANDRYFFQDFYQAGTSSYTGTLSVHNILQQNDGISNAHTTELSEMTYYTELEGQTIPVSSGLQAQYTQAYTLGRLAKVSTNGERTAWYSYDQFGRIAFEIQQVNDASFGSLPNADDYFKATEFEYEPLLGQITAVIYQDHEASERFRQFYTYNGNRQLIRVEARRGNGTGTLAGEADYFYNTHFQLARKELGGDLQGIDYIYRMNGALKAVNHPSLGATNDPGGDGGTGSAFYADLFGYSIDFFKDDYTSNDNSILSSVTSTDAHYYRGLVASVRYKINDTYAPDADLINKGGSTTTLISTGTDECRFTYAYDEYFRLANAHFDVYHHTSATASSNTATAYSDYKVYGAANTTNDIEYDANGNILNLYRNGYEQGGEFLIDKLIYGPVTGSNRLGTIQDQCTTAIASLGFPNSGTSLSMSYDASGRLRQSFAEDIQDITYHHSGKVQKVLYTSTSDYIEYFYDHHGSVCRSLFHDFSAGTTHTTWYINSAGRTVAIYEKETAASSLSLIEYPIVGHEREGTFDTQQEAAIYELKDHLGNVRVAFKEGSSTLEVVSWADYYPFGSTLPGRSYSLNAYRYGSGGEETAYSTGWTAYPLRMFNTLLGRFGAPDPYRQMHNAYQGMANNPANFIDPTGGIWDGYNGWVQSNYEQWEMIMGGRWEFNQTAWKEAQAYGLATTIVDGLPISTRNANHHFRNNVHKKRSASLGHVVRGTDPKTGERKSGIASSVSSAIVNMIGKFEDFTVTNGRIFRTERILVHFPSVLDDGGKVIHDGEWVSFPIAKEISADGLIESDASEINDGQGDWDFWGKGSVPYTGNGIGGTNFIGPGPDADPYRLTDPLNPDEYLRPIDAIDGAAQAHDDAYWKAKTGGVTGALFNLEVTSADIALFIEAAEIMSSYRSGGTDPITGHQVSERTFNLATAVYYTFGAISFHKVRPATLNNPHIKF